MSTETRHDAKDTDANLREALDTLKFVQRYLRARKFDAGQRDAVANVVEATIAFVTPKAEK
jgi:hypothetical protein